MKRINDFFDKINAVVPYLLLCVYSVVTVLTMMMTSDDFVWHYIRSNDGLYKYREPNGRYFSNFITTIITSHSAVRFIFITLTLALTIYLLSRLMDHEKKSRSVKLCYVLSLIILIPAPTYREALLWTSAFTNYVLSLMLTVIFILFFFKALFSDYDFKLYHLILFPALALAGGLCVEHIAIYDILLGIAAVVLLRIRRKSFFAAPFAYLISSCIAAYLMFNSNVYSQIAGSGDTQAMRGFNIDLSDIFMNFVFVLIPGYSKKLWIVNLVIAFSLLIIFLNSYEKVKKSKYAVVCMVIAIVYSVYTALNSTYSTFVILNESMRIRGFEAAFTFLYLVALAYLIWIFFDFKKKTRLYFYLISTIMLTAPFLLVKPVSARCYFAEYIFWIIFSGDLFFSALPFLRLKTAKYAASVGVFATAYVCAWMLGMNITNKYFYDLRFDYFKQQVEEGKTSDIMIIEFPYEDYTMDDLKRDDYYELELGEGITYFTLIYDYYGIDAYDIPYNELTFISTFDYYRLNEG